MPHNSSDAKKEGKRMKRFRKFLNDLREPLGIGMKRLMIALAIILGIVIVTIAGWLLWSRIGLAYARNKVSDTYLQNQPALPVFRGGQGRLCLSGALYDLLHAVGRTDGAGR